MAQQQSADPAALAHARKQEAEILAPQWIRNADPRHQAWAAHLIGRERLTALLPLLIDYVRQYRHFGTPVSAADFDRIAAVNVALDALIQLDAQVPGRVAADLFERFPAQAMILLARDPTENREILLSIMDQTRSDEVWLAAGNLLANSRAAGFAWRLMNEIRIHPEITVVMRGAGGFGAGGAGGVSRCPFGKSPRQGWPEAGYYSLTLHPERGTTLLAAGKHPVYYTRALHSGHGYIWSGGQIYGDRDPFRHEYLAKLSNNELTPLSLALQPYLSVEWSGEEAYLTAVEEFLQRQRLLFHLLAAQFRKHDLMTLEEQQSVRLRVSVTITDMRGPSAPPLPLLPRFSDPGPPFQ